MSRLALRLAFSDALSRFLFLYKGFPLSSKPAAPVARPIVVVRSLPPSNGSYNRKTFTFKFLKQNYSKTQQEKINLQTSEAPTRLLSLASVSFANVLEKNKRKSKLI